MFPHDLIILTGTCTSGTMCIASCTRRALTARVCFTMATFMAPVRCTGCGKVTANLIEPYHRLVASGMDSASALNQLKLVRYCCRRMIITNVEEPVRMELPPEDTKRVIDQVEKIRGKIE